MILRSEPFSRLGRARTAEIFLLNSFVLVYSVVLLSHRYVSPSISDCDDEWHGAVFAALSHPLSPHAGRVPERVHRRRRPSCVCCVVCCACVLCAVRCFPSTALPTVVAHRTAPPARQHSTHTKEAPLPAQRPLSHSDLFLATGQTRAARIDAHHARTPTLLLLTQHSSPPHRPWLFAGSPAASACLCYSTSGKTCMARKAWEATAL